jgi:hypothetical protein
MAFCCLSTFSFPPNDDDDDDDAASCAYTSRRRRPTDRLTNDTPPKQKDESRGGAVGPRTGAGRGGVRAPPRVVVGVGSCGCGRGLEPRRRRHPHGRAVQSRGLVRGYRRRRREGIGDREGSAGAGIQLHGPQVRDGGAVVVVVVYP